MENYTFNVRYARRIPDPVFKEVHGSECHIFIVPVRSMPQGLPDDPNARRPKISKRIYQDVEESLLNRNGEPGTFHLKNKGIVVIADSVEQQSNSKYVVSMLSGIHGIVDGGHTYKLIERNLDNPDLPEKQFVTVEVRTKIPEGLIPEIAGGLNTSVQVAPMSLDNLAQKFNWLKKEIRDQAYADKIAWSENDPGEFDGRDLITLLTMFNVELFSNEKDEHPVMGYERKAGALKEFEKREGSYQRMTPIVKDIFRLHDIIRKNATTLYNKETGGKAGSLAFVEKRKQGVFDFVFTGDTHNFRLMNGALYPMLAAFRWYVVSDPQNLTTHWRKDFNEVLQAWEGMAGELMRATVQTSNELGRNPNAIGKSRNHWSSLHARVAKSDLLSSRQAV